MTDRAAPKTWVVNDAHVTKDTLEQDQLVVGLTTLEWIRLSGDQERPGDATTFVWVVVSIKTGSLLEIGFRPHSHVTEQECIDQVRVLLAIVRPWSSDDDPRALLGRQLPRRGA